MCDEVMWVKAEGSGFLTYGLRGTEVSGKPLKRSCVWIGSRLTASATHFWIRQHSGHCFGFNLSFFFNPHPFSLTICALLDPICVYWLTWLTISLLVFISLYFYVNHLNGVSKSCTLFRSKSMSSEDSHLEFHIRLLFIMLVCSVNQVLLLQLEAIQPDLQRWTALNAFIYARAALYWRKI